MRITRGVVQSIAASWLMSIVTFRTLTRWSAKPIGVGQNVGIAPDVRGHYIVLNCGGRFRFSEKACRVGGSFLRAGFTFAQFAPWRF